MTKHYTDAEIDALLVATEGHTPGGKNGEWYAVETAVESVPPSAGDDSNGYFPAPDEYTQETRLVITPDEPDGSDATYCRVVDLDEDGDDPDNRLIHAAPALRAVVVQLLESLRRAQLLTPESVKAVCEREGFEWDGKWWILTSANLAVERVTGWPACCVYRTTGQWTPVTNALLTIGQLEDAIAAAKGGK